MSTTVYVGYGGSVVQLQSKTLQGVSINYGRTDLSSSPAPMSCSLSILWDSSLGTLDPDLFLIGNGIGIANDTGWRFQGEMTDVSVNKDVISITAVSRPLSRLSRLTLDFTGLSSSSGVVLGSALSTIELAIGYIVKSVSIGTVGVTAPTSTAANALDYLQQIADSEPSGVLSDDRNARLWFTDANDRRTTTPAATLLASEISNAWTAERRVSSKANRARVGWTGGTVQYDDTADQATYGVYEDSVTTLINNSSDATILATRMVKNQTVPDWQLSELTLELSTLSAARQLALTTAFQISNLIEIPTLFAGLQTKYFVEGYSERIGQTSWSITLYLSDITLTRPADRWIDVPVAEQWNTLAPALTWDQAWKEPVR
jgi:hypothetical protein